VLPLEWQERHVEVDEVAVNDRRVPQTFIVFL
jgi:hypothetical protein